MSADVLLIQSLAAKGVLLQVDEDGGLRAWSKDHRKAWTDEEREQVRSRRAELIELLTPDEDGDEEDVRDDDDDLVAVGPPHGAEPQGQSPARSRRPRGLVDRLWGYGSEDL